MSDNGTPEISRLKDVDTHIVDFSNWGGDSQHAASSTRKSSYPRPSSISPLTHFAARSSKGHRLVRHGLILMAVSGVLWILISNMATLQNAARFDNTRTAIANGSFEQPSMPSGGEIWFITTVAQLSVAGFFVGMVMVIVGYARLFLDKQAVFEQHVNEQLNVIAQGDVEATQLAKGATYMSDRTNIGGDVIGSAVGRDASVNARDITVFKQTVDSSTKMDADLKSKLSEARDEIDKLDIPQDDKHDVTDDLGKLTEELDKPEPTPSRVERFLKRIEEIAPSVASVLASATRIIHLVAIAT